MHDGQVRLVSTAALSFWSVRFDGTNLEQVLDVASTAPPPPPGFGAVGLMSATPHPLVRLWDARVGGFCIAAIGDWVIADTDGILVLAGPWFDALFGPDPEELRPYGRDGRLDHIAELASALSVAVVSLQATPVPAAPSPRGGPLVDDIPPHQVAGGAWGDPEQVWTAAADPYAARNLTPVQPPHIGTPEMPRKNDVWVDRYERTWTVIDEGQNFWDSTCVGEDGQVAGWQSVQAQLGPMRLAHRVVDLAAA